MKFFFLFTLFFQSLFGGESSASPLDIAMNKYAEAMKNPEQKEALLNDALSIYLSLYKENPSAEYLANIGNIFLALHDFGMASYYYLLALQQKPRDVALQNLLHYAQAQAGVEEEAISRPIARVFGMRWASPYERNLFLTGLSFITFFFFSLSLWLPKSGFRAIFYLFLAFSIFSFSSVLWYSLLLSPRGVVIKGAPLYLGPSSQNPSSITMKSGAMVEIVSSNPPWIFIKTSTHHMGYLPEDAVRSID